MQRLDDFHLRGLRANNVAPPPSKQDRAVTDVLVRLAAWEVDQAEMQSRAARTASGPRVRYGSLRWNPEHDRARRPLGVGIEYR